MRPSPNHPAVRAKKAHTYNRWSCLICGLDGLGGVQGWSTHYQNHHNNSGETP